MDDQHKPTGAAPPMSALQKAPLDTKPAGQSRRLEHLRASGPDGRLAKVIGAAVALLDTASQTALKHMLLKSSKKQYHAEIIAAFADVDA